MDSERSIGLFLWVGGTLFVCVVLYVASRFAMRRWGETNLIAGLARPISILPLLSLIVSWVLFVRIRWSTGLWPFWDSSFIGADGEMSAYNPTRQGVAFEPHFAIARYLDFFAISSIFLIGPIALAAASEVPRLRRSAWVFAGSWLALFAMWRIDPGGLMSWLNPG